MYRDFLRPFTILALCSIVFLFLGIYAETGRPDRMLDFEIVYVAARARIQHLDPYKETDFLKSYSLDSTYRSSPAMSPLFRKGGTRCINLPTTLLLVAPLSLLPWSCAHVAWFLISAIFLIAATFAVHNLSPPRYGTASAALCGFVLVNSTFLLAGGNASGVALGMSICGVWSLLKRRYEAVGLILIGVALAIKPHDVVFLVIYFFLAGATYRKRFWQMSFVTLLLGVGAAAWVSRTAPSWISELHANLGALSLPSEINDLAQLSQGPFEIISLQALFSLVRDDPGFYNLTSYTVSGLCLLIWAITVTFKGVHTKTDVFLGIGTAAPLSMLPVYHRFYDAKLLLLTIPACLLLWQERSRAVVGSSSQCFSHRTLRRLHSRAPAKGRYSPQGRYPNNSVDQAHSVFATGTRTFLSWLVRL
jgi:hypothetical protein